MTAATAVIGSLDVMPADVLVVGAGPAGAVAAAALAAAGHRVVIVDRAIAPGTKPCGELVTPRAVAALERAGIDRLDTYHAISHIRLTTSGHSTSTAWPSHDEYRDRGFVAPRPRLEAQLQQRAIAAGARLLRGHDATAPIVERGFVRGAHVTRHDGSSLELRAAFTVVADGADSRFGRALGTYREPAWPAARAHRAIYASGLHDTPEIELILDLTDRAGTPITGYGWMFPRGDGTANIGVLILSTSPSFQVVNPAHLLDQCIDANAGRWRLAGDPVVAPAGGRIPIGSSVGPAAGPTYLVVGDAAGAANPLSGAGIEYAIETGLLAAGVLVEALSAGNAAPLQRYPKLLGDRYGSYFKVGRMVDRMLGRPSIATRFGRLASSRPAVASGFVRLAGNELRARHPGAPEFAYRVGRAISTFAPDG
jgi:geranylgeranyl reductase family protein